MKAKPKTLVTALTVFGLLAVAGGKLWAQPAPQGSGLAIPMTITATATVQQPDNDNGTVDTFPTSTVKINTQWFVQQIATAAATNFPSTAVLGLNPDGSVSVFDKKGNDLYDVSTNLMTVALDPDGTGVWKGTSNDNTSQASFTGTYLTALYYGPDNAGNILTVWGGLTKETYSLSAANVNTGSQSASDSISVTAVGDGFLVSSSGTNNVIFSGTMTGSVKGPE
jgi:hypothetical protein